MKMETTITAHTYLTIKDIFLQENTFVNTDDLVMGGV